MTEDPIVGRLRACDAVVAWCLRSAARRESAVEIEQAALWSYVGAMVASQCGHSRLCVHELEAMLLRLAHRVARNGASARARPATPQRWLHVCSITTAVGGHSALVRRWIAHNPLEQRHAVVLTAQAAEAAAPGLAQATRATGGFLRSLAPLRSLMSRAAALRELAYAEADVVVLHVHPWDILPALAFGVPGGPPVLLMNHADHAYWAGCAVADCVVDFRDSGASLTKRWRAPRAVAHLPLPLDDHGIAVPDRQAAASLLDDARLRDRDLVMLTIGRGAKYRAEPLLDFPATATRILERSDDAALVGVGPAPDDPLWSALCAATGGRARGVGERVDLRPWLAAADLYLEGFPVGSYTALLEAALAQRAFVRKPLLAPVAVLPVDEGALAAFPQPPDAAAYAQAALALGHDSAARTAAAARARAAVLRVHCTDWPDALAALCARVPPGHDVGLAQEPDAMPPALARYAAGVLPTHATASPLDVAREAAHQQGVWPRPDIAVLDAVRAWLDDAR